MPRCRVDESVERVLIGEFQFPLGVYPVEPMTPRAGYAVDFEPADGGEPDGLAGGGLADEPSWEEWPDRYAFDVVISAERLEPLCRSLFALLPGRIYPILDYLGQDAYREVDPFISYDLLGMDRFQDAVRRFRGFFVEDGLVGFGAMTDDPFLYVFVDEHKIVTVRAETALRERVERVLAAFDLSPIEDEHGPMGADAAAHEHRGVLLAPEDRPDLLTAEEIVEHLRDEWRLVLNIDPDRNTDEEGRDLGITPWRCLVRCFAGKAEEERPRYLDVVLTARSLRRAEELALDAAEEMLPEGQEEWDEAAVVGSDRIGPERWAEMTGGDPAAGAAHLAEEGIREKAWLE